MNHLIIVRVDKKGNFTYTDFAAGATASELCVGRGDKVAWYVERDGKPSPYTITFKGTSPFGKKTVKVEKGGISPLLEVTAASGGIGMQYGVRINSRLEHDPEIRIDGPDDLADGGFESTEKPRRGEVVRVACGSAAVAAAGDWVLFSCDGEFTVRFEKSPFSSGELVLKSRGGQAASRKVGSAAGEFAYTAKLKSGKSLQGTIHVGATASAAG